MNRYYRANAAGIASEQRFISGIYYGSSAYAIAGLGGAAAFEVELVPSAATVLGNARNVGSVARNFAYRNQSRINFAQEFLSNAVPGGQGVYGPPTTKAAALGWLGGGLTFGFFN